jgi:hypothetical protein
MGTANPVNQSIMDTNSELSRASADTLETKPTTFSITMSRKESDHGVYLCCYCHDASVNNMEALATDALPCPARENRK